MTAVLMLIAMVAVALQPAHAATNPTVTNLAASGVLDNSANANCSVNPGDNPVNVWVVYRKASDTWTTGPVYATEKVKGEGATTQTFTFALPYQQDTTDDPEATASADLVPSTQYVYRCKVGIREDGNPTPVAIDTVNASFTTAADDLTVTNGESAGVAEPSVDPVDEEGGIYATDQYMVTCNVDPKAQTKVWPVYKESTSTWSAGPVYGGRTSEETITIPTTSTRTQPVSFVLTGLSAGTTYDWRCKADTSGQSTVTDSNTQQFTVPNSGTGAVAFSAPAATSTSSASTPIIWTSKSCRTGYSTVGYEYWYSYVAWAPEWKDAYGRWHAQIVQASWKASDGNYFGVTGSRYVDINLISYNNNGYIYQRMANDNMHGGAAGDTWYLYRGEIDKYTAPADPIATGPVAAKINVRMGWANDADGFNIIPSCDAFNYEPSNFTSKG
jgi:hypothetical protein